VGRRLNYANVTATLALFFAMSGGALAAKHYLINSTRQINPKVLTALKGKPGPTGATGATGAPGAPGKEGTAGKEGKEGKEGATGKEGKEGKEGARGPSDVWQAGDGSASSTQPLSVSVPAGSYLVQAKTVVSAGAGESICILAGGSASDNAKGSTEASGITEMTLTNVETTVLSTPGTIKLECTGGAGQLFRYAKLTATQVGAVH
jgi:hypothetical protein